MGGKHLTSDLIDLLLSDPSEDRREALRAILEHLDDLCPRCRAVYRAETESRKQAAMQEVVSGVFATVSERFPLLTALEREGQRDLRVLLKLKPHERQTRLARARSRFRSPYLVDLLLEEARSLLRDDPFEAEKLAETAQAVAMRLREEVVHQEWILTFVARAMASRGNALRVQGALREAAPLLEQGLELYSAQGNCDPLVLGELLRLLASLRSEQHRLQEAQDLIDAAIEIYLQCAEELHVLRCLVKKADLLADHDQLGEALQILDAVEDQIDADDEPRLHLCVVYNRAWYLRELGRCREAREVLSTHKERFDGFEDSWTRLRYFWCWGRIAADLGELEEAKRSFQAARMGFLEESLAYDAACVGLDLALVYVGTGETSQLRELAAEMMPIFLEQEIHAEAMAALMLFNEAARQERVTASMLLKLSSHLEDLRRRPRERPS